MTLITFFILVQLAGFTIDGVWHGLLHPGFEPTSRPEIARHLLTVHLPLYVGVAGLFAAIALALARRARRGMAHPALWVALGGAGLQVLGEGWHVLSHLTLAPDAVVPAMFGLAGFALALASLGIAWRRVGRVRHARGRVRHASGPVRRAD